MDIKNLAIISGNTGSIENGTIKYMYKKVEIENADLKFDTLFVRSDINFANGELEFKLKTEAFDIGALVIFKSFDNTNILCGYSKKYNQFVIAIENSEDWQILAKAGRLSNFNIKTNIDFKIVISGSYIQLFINKILMCESHAPIKESPIEFRLGGHGNIEITSIKCNKEISKIFVVMQFANDFNELYLEVIKPVVEEFGYECIRADEYYTGTPILKDIIDSIQKSSAIIAEITPDNPNVFYEIGYSHAIGKPTILLCDKKREKLPFDLSSFRTLFYENTIAGKKKVETSLKKYLNNI